MPENQSNSNSDSERQQQCFRATATVIQSVDESLSGSESERPSQSDDRGGSEGEGD